MLYWCGTNVTLLRGGSGQAIMLEHENTSLSITGLREGNKERLGPNMGHLLPFESAGVPVRLLVSLLLLHLLGVKFTSGGVAKPGAA